MNGLWYISFGQYIYIYMEALVIVVPTRKAIAMEIKMFSVSEINSCGT